MNQLSCWGLAELNQHDYAVIGEGGFTKIFLDVLKRHNIKPPVQVLAADRPTLAHLAPDYLIVGTDTFQLEVMERWSPYLKHKQKFIDISDIVLCHKYGVKLPVIESGNPESTYVLFCGVGAAVNEGRWLYPLRQQLKQLGIGWQRLHPLDERREMLLAQASAIIVWNGSRRIYKELLEQCALNKKSVTYAECGFFPQAAHFYFDKEGVNLNSQLRTDDLSWLSASDLEIAENYRRDLIQGRQLRNSGYVFVPLQIAADSNVQNHSSFVNGMQQYIDFIVSKYPGEQIIFKVHPKDQYATNYKFYDAQVSSSDTLDLIANAALVRGINSSVLFEAALVGKPVQADGACLLNSSMADAHSVVKAIIARQYRTTAFKLDQAKLTRFSNLGHLFYD